MILLSSPLSVEQFKTLVEDNLWKSYMLASSTSQTSTTASERRSSLVHQAIIIVPLGGGWILSKALCHLG